MTTLDRFLAKNFPPSEREEHLAALDRIAQKEDIPLHTLLLRYIYCKKIHLASFEDYCTFKLYLRSGPWLSRFLTWGRAIQISDQLIEKATREDYDTVGSKVLFNRHFKDYIQREWLYLPDCSPDDITEFVRRTPKFLLKACGSTQGQDITLLERDTFDAQSFLREYFGKPYLLEAFIQQHPALAAPNPSSVNTVRVVTARKGDRVMIVGAGLRCGGNEAFVDNLHHGGIAYPIHLETGIVSGPGVDYRGEHTYIRHPSTGHIMPGLEIPHWEILLDAVKKAALLSPLGYLGWDVAVTETGIDIIEANVNVPGITVIQLDRPDAYARLKQFLAE